MPENRHNRKGGVLEMCRDHVCFALGSDHSKQFRCVMSKGFLTGGITQTLRGTGVVADPLGQTWGNSKQRRKLDDSDDSRANTSGFHTPNTRSHEAETT